MKLFGFFNSDFLADTEGGQSMKRLAFALLVIFFVAISAVLLLHGIDVKLTAVAQSVLDKTVDLIKWLGALILGDKVPAAVRAFRGNKPQGDDAET